FEMCCGVALKRYHFVTLAFKWLRILCHCWQTRTPYDESKYLNALRRRIFRRQPHHRVNP
ncbi:MAG: hypothetical protein V3R56_01275, partial [Xanthomonadales bacterium]